MQRFAPNSTQQKRHVPLECSCIGTLILLCARILRTSTERCFSQAYGDIEQVVTNERWSSLMAETKEKCSGRLQALDLTSVYSLIAMLRARSIIQYRSLLAKLY